MDARFKERYDRQIMLLGIENQKRLKDAKVLVVGAGGLGSATLNYLVAAGVGNIILIDNGVIELSNLNRQILYNEEDLGKSKAKVACEKLRKLNSEINIECHESTFSYELGKELVKKVDIAIDALDNWESRFILNKLCVNYRKPFVHAGIEGWYGQITTIFPGKGPCLYCLIRKAKTREKIPIIGVTPGVLGVLEAAEAIKMILGVGEPLIGRLLIVDLYTMDFKIITIKRDPNCPVCGSL